MTKLTVAFSDFANTHKNVQKTRLCAQVAQKLDVRLVESQKFGFSGDNPVQSTAATSINIHYDITP
jgi:hypothetical protein